MNEEIKVSRNLKISALALACSAVFAAQIASAAPAADVERVVGSELLQLVREAEAADAALPQHLTDYLHDAKGNVLVHLHMKNSVDARPHLQALATAGLKDVVVSRIDPSHVEGYVSLRDVRRLVGMDVVRSATLTETPVRFAGSVQSQAVALEKANVAHVHGFDGTGIRIGALSDSYDACASCATHAADDIASRDLPPDGVTVLEEDPHATTAADEGRAMLQLIHDLAPGAQLGFATAFAGQLKFANNILDLRETFGADVITDDVVYFSEPFYSDGLIAQAVDRVVSEGAAYFSSAGNNGLEAYEAQYEPLPWSTALKLSRAGGTPLKLGQLPPEVVPKSVHIFNGHTSKGVRPAIGNRMTVVAGLARVILQWDEPFFHDKVKTDYNIYIFDAKGNWIRPHGGLGHDGQRWPVRYSFNDNTATDEPLEIAGMAPTGELKGDIAQTDYYIMIGKMNAGPAPKIKYIVANALAPAEYQGAPSTWGHAAAANGQAVAATYYAIPNAPEGFSSAGPVMIEFDTDGNPLPAQVIRHVPQITAADGIDNTFFGFDSDFDGLPNFFGTSAAAPDAAGVAALILQAAGGPGSMAPADVYTTMQQTARQIPVANERNKAHADAGPVKLQIADDWTRWENYFELQLGADATGPVASVVLDLSGTNGFVFNPILTRFYLGASNGVTRSDITYSVSSDQKQATLVFAPGSFAPGDRFHFGDSVFNPLQGSTQQPAEQMRGLVVTVTMEDGTTHQGTVTAQQTRGVNRWTGAGLVDAAAAIRSIVKN